MAKKKTDSAGEGSAEEKKETKAPAKKPAAKPAAKGGAKKAAAKKSAPAPAAGGAPLIDTDLAAQNAARMLAAKAKLKGATQGAGSTGDSASFKQLKESINKPATGGPSDLSKALGPQKTHLPVREYNQIFHNQTQGGVARVNVPRRTGG